MKKNRNLEHNLKELSAQLNCINSQRIEVNKKIINACLEIVKLAETGKLSLKAADRLFSYFLPNDDLLFDKLHDIVLDGASLELLEENLEDKLEINLMDIKKRLLESKIAVSA
jgi:hypothetical protein